MQAKWVLPSTGFAGLSPSLTAALAPNDNDWYRLPAASTASKFVTAWIEGATETFGSSELDTRLEMYRGDTADQIGLNDDIEPGIIRTSGLVGVPLLEDVSAVLRVYGFDEENRGLYRLHTLTNLGNEAGTTRNVMETEPNNSPATANVFNDGVNISASINNVGEQDWYEIDMGTPGQEDLLVALRNDTSADLKVEVWEPDGVAPLAGTSFDGGTADNDYLSIPFGKHPSWIKRFRVYSTGTTGSYRLFFGTGIPSGLLCQSSPEAIPDGDTVDGVTQTLEVRAQAILTDLDVRVRIRHPDIKELRVQLTHVDTGTTVQLHAFSCPGSPDMNVVFDDQVASATCPYATGDQVPPFEPLQAFAGESAEGTWAINVIDTSPGLAGTLESWCLDLVGSISTDSLPTCNNDTDITGDGAVDALDLLELIRQLRGQGTPGAPSADLDCSGVIDGKDVLPLEVDWKSP